jgi:hypothetical protein
VNDFTKLYFEVKKLNIYQRIKAQYKMTDGEVLSQLAAGAMVTDQVLSLLPGDPQEWTEEEVKKAMVKAITGEE